MIHSKVGAMVLGFAVVISTGAQATPGKTLIPGDVNCDDHVDISDVVFLVASLYLGAGPPCPIANRPELLAQVTDLQGQVAQLEFTLAGKETDLLLAAQREVDLKAQWDAQVADLQAQLAASQAELEVWKEKVAELERKLSRQTLPGTGQMKCYDQDGNSIACDSASCPGQDGFYQAGCPSEGRFVDNADGTVTDTCTGLMWQKDTANVGGDGAVSWCEALTYCENLNFAGHDDWRLPNVRELQSIVEYHRGNESRPIDPIFDGSTANCWSSTTSQYSSTWALVVSFHYATVIDLDKVRGDRGILGHVRAVRSRSWAEVVTFTVLPHSVYQIGTQTFGPVAIPAGPTQATLALDGTFMTDPALNVTVRLELSLDGGATWGGPATVPYPIGAGIVGGAVDKHGVPVAEYGMGAGLPDPTNHNRQMRGSLTIAGTPLITTVALTVR